MPAASFIIFRTRRRAVDMSLQHMTWPEHQNAARQNGHFFAGLRVPADAAALLPDRKGSEPTDFNRFTFFQMQGDTLQDIFQKIG